MALHLRSTALTRTVALARGAWGATLLAAPRPVLKRYGHPAPGMLPVVVLRVLGARHVIQAATTAAVPEAAVADAGAAVDVLHAASGLGLAAASRTWRFAGLTDGAIAAAFATAGWTIRPRPRPLDSMNTQQKGPVTMSARRVAVVTGGSAGVGRAAVRELAENGWDVAVLARGHAGLDGAVNDAEKRGARALGIPTDVADLDQVRSAADQVERELGEIELWVNVAFAGSLRFFWDTDPEAYRRMTDVTYFGTVHGTRVALERMRPRNRGTIIQTGSALAFRGIPLQSAYCGAKHAIIGFTESVITELRHEKSKVRICMVQLPAVNTVQFDWNDSEFDKHPMPVPPIFQPEPPARAIRYLADHPRRNMWVGASTAATIWANRLMPSVLDWYLGRTGVNSQLTAEQGPRYGSNVFEPRDDEQDRGSHGMFDDKAHGSDPWSAVSIRRGPIAAGISAGVGGATLVAAARRARRH